MNNVKTDKMQVLIWGFGRIGRILTRILAQEPDSAPHLALRAICVRKNSQQDIHTRASLLEKDSVYRRLSVPISVNEQKQTIILGNSSISVLQTEEPQNMPYGDFGIKNAILIETTGKSKTKEALAKHTQNQSVCRAILTAPADAEIKHIVYGVNHDQIGTTEHLSAASCTTNAITPILFALNGQFGIDHAHIETVHSFTNDQNLTDNFHKSPRRSRSAVLNMIITETGATKTTEKILPELAGKLTGSAVRVPTPNVSLAILNLSLRERVTKESINAFLQSASKSAQLSNQIDYITDLDAASSDFVGWPKCAIVDSSATIASGNRAVIYIWYDNEYGYAKQVIRIAEYIAEHCAAS